MTFELAPEAVDDVYACKSKYWLYDKTWISNVLKNFKSFSVAWGERAYPEARGAGSRTKAGGLDPAEM